MTNPWMQFALKAAHQAKLHGDVPIGAVVVRNGEIIGTGCNTRERDHLVAGHAEMQALANASSRLGTGRMDGCDLYVTLEPCMMCAGAIIQSHIRRLYFGAWDPKAGVAGSCLDLFREPWLNHRVEVYAGIDEEACSTLLREWFRSLRDGKMAQEDTIENKEIPD